ncbi:MAG: hypothetical protein A3A80_02075 [Candidatus Terrybacteria bacterium RIFCSPLOWO2_01_FULL_44_24]|uniref:TIGR00725 family protein n=1 Tax=Candidatus Terrybacteria bacterium RIFCSPHIGHO2_01_FULL_43_35 TaxID=1802361 RepID=A0A1G2PE59_9BACT|nr:MAG: hypothetical protein A2828_01865 [Candidatus Terrybacteria bacterium RIFCSPHIGHO2_01_FULL_43_35]OHA50868.1 MAG: hypothetical protein A3A80_02075 [Candidatus Terrybacteria bacterium RIFCSPLOWO2_01_FULL_44_24]
MSNKYQKYKICVSGAAETDWCSPKATEFAKEVGREIILQGGVLVTGATNGIPYWAAIGAKEAGGLSIGLSPAASEEAHVKTYRLPTDYFDIIVYTGFDYSGRNLLLTRAADAVILICGRMGTLNEFTIAFEDKKPIGVLVGSGGVTEIIKSLVARAHRGTGAICYDSNPKRLVAKVIKLLEESQTKNIRSNTSSQKNRRRIK